MDEGEKWIKVDRKANKLTTKIAPYYLEISNQYSQLEEFAADPDPPKTENKNQP